jgi:hypothetical protein
MSGELSEVHASEILNPEKWSSWGDATCDRIIAVLLYGSWNVRVTRYTRYIPLFVHVLQTRNPKVKITGRIGVKVDHDDESYELSIDLAGLGAPSELPAIAFVGLPSSTRRNEDDNNDSEKRIRCEYVSLSGRKLDSYLSTAENGWDELHNDMQATLSRLVDAEGKLKTAPIKQSITRTIVSINSESAIRLFIAGDRSQVGKSSICMGILGALLKSGKYSPTDLAYIKPATQCEQTQLVQEFCKAKGISACVPIGPIVYYKGFTRAFLKGDIDETSEQMLVKAGLAVDELAVGKKVVIIDGVGYPAVGSITGTDNASVAKSCGIKLQTGSRVPVPVLLIGKSGVGDAVDSFNINATYFTHRGVPVIGAIFNKLSLEGFYSLENCKEAIEMYFNKFQPDKTAFGFIPEIPSLKNARENMASISEEEQLKQALETADALVDQFRQSVNIEAILKAANDATNAYRIMNKDSNALVRKRQASIAVSVNHPSKQLNNSVPASKQPKTSLTRTQIEAMAAAAGAAGG